MPGAEYVVLCLGQGILCCNMTIVINYSLLVDVYLYVMRQGCDCDSYC
jgi:hypothetical protein